MKITELMIIAVMVAAIASPGYAFAAQNDARDRDYGNQTMDQNYGVDDNIPGINAGRGPSFSDPQVEQSPWGGRVSPYPPYHQDTR
jgi:hypothetical protein